MLMMMKLGGELYAARLRLDGLAAKTHRITCNPALATGTCSLAVRLSCCRVQYLLLQGGLSTRYLDRSLATGSTNSDPIAAVGQGSCVIPVIWGRWYNFGHSPVQNTWTCGINERASRLLESSSSCRRQLRRWPPDWLGGASCQLLPTVKRHGEVAPRTNGTGSSSANSSEPRNLSSIQAFWLRFGGLRPAGMT